MTITSPDLHDDQGWLDNGPSLVADPWSDNWTLPTAEELKAIGWPGARPGMVVDVREVESTSVGRQDAGETSVAPITSAVHRPPKDSAPDDSSDCEPFASPWSSSRVASLSEQRSRPTG